MHMSLLATKSTGNLPLMKPVWQALIHWDTMSISDHWKVATLVSSKQGAKELGVPCHTATICLTTSSESIRSHTRQTCADFVVPPPTLWQVAFHKLLETIVLAMPQLGTACFLCQAVLITARRNDHLNFQVQLQVVANLLNEHKWPEQWTCCSKYS